MGTEVSPVRSIDPDKIDEQVDLLSPFDEPLHSVWKAVSESIEAGSNHIIIARNALKAALHGTLARKEG